MQMHQTSRRITERKQEMIGAIDAVCNVAVAASTGISKKIHWTIARFRAADQERQ